MLEKLLKRDHQVSLDIKSGVPSTIVTIINFIEGNIRIGPHAQLEDADQ